MMIGRKKIEQDALAVHDGEEGREGWQAMKGSDEEDWEWMWF